MRKVLVIGYGNPGRLDDGLGPALAQAIERRNLPGVTVDADYQLLVEDAAAVAEADVAIFADASVNGPEPFAFEALEPQTPASFSSHSMEPAAVLALARDMFSAGTRAYTLAIRGYEFDAFGERLSVRAAENLAQAVDFLERTIRNGEIRGSQ